MLLKKQMARMYAKMKALHLRIKKNVIKLLETGINKLWNGKVGQKKRSIKTFDTGDQIFSRRTEELVEAWSEGTEKDSCLAGESADRSKCLNEIMREMMIRKKRIAPMKEFAFFLGTCQKQSIGVFLGLALLKRDCFTAKAHYLLPLV